MRSDAQEQLDRVIKLVRHVFGRDTVGVYLYGSAVLGGLRPRSDLDLLVVTRRPATREDKLRLVDRLLAVSAQSDPVARSRSVDLTIVVEGDVRPWRYPPRLDFQYGDWLRGEFERGNVEPWPTTNPDLASLITMVLLADRPLLGPPPSQILDPVPHTDLVSAIVGEVDALLGSLDRDTRNVVLTLARIWSTVATGAIRSKDVAADWALTRLPQEHRVALAHARAVYVGDEEERWHELELRVHLYANYVAAQISRLAAERAAGPATRPRRARGARP